MSTDKPARIKRVTVPMLREMKQHGTPITMLTAYDYPFARLFDEAGVDTLLVGDSLGMVVQGRNTTLPVTLDHMIYHGEMVARAAKRALVIVDMPFMSYQVSPQQAVESAGRIMKETEAAAVKLEGGVDQAETISRIVRADIPVMGHIGMTPQSVHLFGSMSKIQRDADKIIAEAKAVEEAGAFAIVLELIPKDLAREISSQLSIPTIGIGAGPHCDGQVLVMHDMLGIVQDFHPKFVKRFEDLKGKTTSAVQSYIEEVRSHAYPSDAHSHA
ncbi:3-methyl-2-oxobutanoate hydroxymethyltransferase [Lacunimicrobium album]